MRSDRATTAAAAVLGVAASLAGVMFFSGCGRGPRGPAGPAGPAPKAGGVVGIVLPEEPTSLNGMTAGGERMSTRVVLGQMRWGLLAVRPDFGYEPRLAEDVPTVENGGVRTSPFTVVFKIRRDARWSDGKPITSRDVVFTWRTIMSKKTKAIWRRGYDRIRSMGTPDDKTVVIRFKEPYSGYLDLFSASAYGYVLPRHALAGKDFNSAETSGPAVVSGPFALERWDPGSAIVLLRNKRFWGEAAWLDRVVFRFAADEAGAEELFRSGAVDAYAPQLDSGVLEGATIARLRGAPGADVRSVPSAVFEQLTLNTRSASLDSVAERRAVAGAIDRAALASVALGDAGAVARGVVPAVASAAPDSDRWSAATLGEAGPGGGPGPGGGKPARSSKVLRLVAPDPDDPADDAARARVMSELAGQLERAGFRVSTETVPGGRLFAEILPKGEFDLAVWAMLWQPTPDLGHVFESGQVPPRGQNYSRYRSPTTDRLLKAYGREMDPARRLTLADAIEGLLARDLPTVPLFNRQAVLAVRAGVHAPAPNPTIEGVFGDLGAWWVDE